MQGRTRRGLGFAVVVAVFGATLGVALADRIECKSNRPCIGTPRDDVIIGTRKDDAVEAKGGSDVIKGRRGDDNTLRGERGPDTIRGALGDDYLMGGDGQDNVKGGSGSDNYVYGNDWGKETIVDAPVADTDLNTGNQIRFDDVTADLEIKMVSGPGPEVTTLGGESTLEWENDTIDIVIDGQGDDVITGRPVPDNIQPFVGGAENVQSGDGNDFIYMADGEPNDSASCGAGANDEIRVDAGDSVDADCEDVQVLRR